jgi:hypothetical protein
MNYGISNCSRCHVAPMLGPKRRTMFTFSVAPFSIRTQGVAWSWPAKTAFDGQWRYGGDVLEGLARWQRAALADFGARKQMLLMVDGLG